jgi:tripartite-type tricarboxylate transporter receptor subunit TctC
MTHAPEDKLDNREGTMPAAVSCRHAAACAAIFALALSAPAAAQSPADFYKQTGLRLVVASGAGGGYDIYSRVLARYYFKHLPGKPNIVVQNMPGAAGITATNWLYVNAPKDGSVILATYSALIDANLTGNTKARFDVRKFNWIGSIAASPLICITWRTSPYTDIRQMIGKPLTAAATGKTGKTATLPLILNQTIGTKFKVIGGYTTSGTTLALERGEVDAMCGIGLSTLQASNPDWIEKKKVHIVAQSGLTKVKELGDVPNVLDLVKGDDRDVFEYGAILEAIGRPYLAPPGVPADRLAALRKGFDETMKDPDFVAEMAKLHLNLGPMDAAEVNKWIDKLYSYPPATIKRIGELYGISSN